MCWTIDFGNEYGVADTLAAHCGVSTARIAATHSAGSELQAIRLTEYSTVGHGWIVGCRGAIEGCESVYDGIVGDVLSAGLRLSRELVSLAERGQWRAIAEQSVSEGAYLDETQFPRQAAVDRIEAELLRYADWPNPLTAFWFATRTRRYIAPCAFGIVGGGKLPLTPFLDDDLVSFLLSIPASMTVDHKFHDDTIQRAYPRCRIAYAKKAERGPSDIRQFAIGSIGAILLRGGGIVGVPQAVVKLAATAFAPSRNYSYVGRHALFTAAVAAAASRM